MMCCMTNEESTVLYKAGNTNIVGRAIVSTSHHYKYPPLSSKM